MKIARLQGLLTDHANAPRRDDTFWRVVGWRWRLRTRRAWLGPIAASPRPQTPPLSWFGDDGRLARYDDLIEVFNRHLGSGTLVGTAPKIAALIIRVLDSDALHPRHGAAQLPAILRTQSHRSRILLVDERATPASGAPTPIRRRRARFRAMLAAAASGHPGAEFWLARSGDPGTGAWLSSRATRLPVGTRHLPDPYSLREVLRLVDHVYVLGASEGMGAVLAGVQTHVFGDPYYAGWDLTKDDLPLPGRTARPTVAAFFDVAFLRLARYLDPATQAPGTLDAVLDCIELQRATAQRFTDLQHVAAVRFQWWKRPFVTPFLAAGGGRLRWVDSPEQVRAGEYAALWGVPFCAPPPSTGIARIRIEDGFIHSAGLGSDMVAPCSQVIDHNGIYFDASCPSDLTFLLNDADFAEAELARAAALRADIVSLGLSKYNLGRRPPAWLAPIGRRIVLVPGQVADDASIRLGTGTIATAEALLTEVRALRPDAFIVYKPHPDVLSGNRNGLIAASHLVDIVDAETDLVSLIERADEVHVLSSLAGFDALLREKPVYTYGLPFYAGWGLTHDALVQPWRARRLSLDMLTAGVLLRYPVYWDWRLNLYTTPEAIVRQLAGAAARPLGKIGSSRTRPLLKAFRWTRNTVRHILWHFHELIEES